MPQGGDRETFVLDAPPREPNWISWLYVVVASLAIFATVPFARAIQEGINESIGSEFFVVLLAAISIVVLVWVVRVCRRRQMSFTSYLWLLGVVAAFAAYAYSMRRNSIETIHFIEAVVYDRPVMVKPAEARLVMDVYTAADLSDDLGEPVTLPRNDPSVALAAK